jgi:hypothetical protein
VELATDRDRGRRLSRLRSQPFLVDGLARLIRRLQGAGAKVILMRDQIQLPFNPAECAQLNAEQPGEYAIVPMPILCSSLLCPAVIGDVLVYKDPYHLSATYAATLTDWLAPLVPGIRDRAAVRPVSPRRRHRAYARDASHECARLRLR